MREVAIYRSMQEAREAYGDSRRVAAQKIGLAPKTLESLGYSPEKIRPHHIGLAAREYGSPELCMQLCTVCEASFPQMPVPRIVEGSPPGQRGEAG